MKCIYPILLAMLQDFVMETTAPLKIHYLSVEEQQQILIPFAAHLPWNSFGRKNLGYLYAIAHGAEVMFDFDDDNLLKFWMRTASPDPYLDIDFIADNLSETGMHYIQTQ